MRLVVEAPFHIVNAPVTIVGDLVEEILRQVETGQLAAWAAIDDSGLVFVAVLASD